MVGSKAEHGGIIKDGAKMVNAMANSTVPKFTFIMGNSYGAGNYAMCGKAYDPRLIVAWPTAKIAVMGGEQAANVLAQVKREALEQAGKEWSKKDEEAFKAPIIGQYARQSSAYYATARLWDDGIIDPKETRQMLALGLTTSLNAPIEPTRFGVFRM